MLWLLACAPDPEPSRCFEERGQLEGPDELVYDLAWSPSDELILVGGTETLRLVRVEDEGRRLEVLQEQRNAFRFNSVAWSADGRHAVVPTGHEVWLLEVDPEWGSFRVVHTAQGFTGELQRGALSPDQRRLLTCDRDGAVQLSALSFDPPGLTVLDALPLHDGACTRVSWSPSGAWAGSAAKDGLQPLLGVDDEGLELLASHPLPEEGAELVWSPTSDERLVSATFGAVNELYVMDASAEGYDVVSTNTDHESGVGALEFNAAGTLLLTGDHDHTVRLYGVGDELELLDTLPLDGEGVHSVRWSRDESLVARTASQFVDHLTVYGVLDCAAN